jgi:hypothetical protein
LRRTALYALAGFLVPTIVGILILGARQDGEGPEFDTFENVNFPFTFEYPDSFDSASSEGQVPALTLDNSNVITVRQAEETVEPSGLPAYAAQLLVDQVASSRSERHSRLQMVRAVVPRDLGDRQGESLLFFFTARNGTFQIDCQYTNNRRREMLGACRKVVNSLEFE